MLTPNEFKAQIDAAGEAVVAAYRNERISEEVFEGFVWVVTSGLKSLFDKLECGTTPVPPLPDLPSDLQLIGTAKDVDGPSDGKGVLPNAFDETLLATSQASRSDRPKPYQNQMKGVLRCEPGPYELKLVHASVLIDGTLHTDREITIDLVERGVELIGWNNMDGTASISLLKPGAQPSFGQTHQAGGILRDAHWTMIDGSPRDQSGDNTHEQQASVFGSNTELFLQFCQFNDCDAWMTIPHKIGDPLNTFYLDEFARLSQSFSESSGHRVLVEYSNRLPTLPPQSVWIKEKADVYYAGDPKRYDRMVGRLSGAVHGYLNGKWSGFFRVLPLGFGREMGEEYMTASGGLRPHFWCRGNADGNWDLLQEK